MPDVLDEYFNGGSIDDILRKREQRKHDEAILKEEIEQYTNAVNRLFSSEDGKFFLKKLVMYCGVNSFDKQLNPAKLIEDSGKRKVFLELIRPFLDKTIRAELEL